MKSGCISFIAALAALTDAATAQDVIELDPITVENDREAEGGAFSASIPQTSGQITKTGTPLIETPRSVTVVNQEQITRRGATNVEQALQYSAGITAGQWGLDNRSDWSYIRGFEPTTYHDGLLSRYGFYNDTKPETFLLEDVSVLKGPASALYGNGSIGGIVNTRSKVAGTPSDDIVQLQFGSHDRAQIGLDTSGVLNESGSLSYRFVGLLRDSKTQVDYSRDDSIALAPSISWKPTDATELKVLLNYQNTETSPLLQFASQWGTLEPAPNGQFLPDSLFVGEPGFDKYNSEQHSITVMLDHKLDNGWSLDASLRYLESSSTYQHAWWAFDNFANFRYNDDGTINRTFYRAENEMRSFVADAKARREYTLGGVEMTTLVGVSYLRGVYDSDTSYGTQVGSIDPFDPVYAGFNDITVTDTPANTIEEVGVYAQNRATFNGRLHLDTGLRFGRIETSEETATFSTDAVSASDSAWSSSAAVLYNFDNGLAPYASYSESFSQEVVGEDVDGNAFEPTRGTQYEVGLKYQPPGTNSLFSFAAFDLTNSNLAVTDPDNPGYQVQTGEASSRGLELEAKHIFGDLLIDAALTFQETENEDGFSIANVPDQFASLWLEYAPSAGTFKGWRVGGGVRYTGAKQDGTDTTETPSYTLYDAMLGYEGDAFDVTLSVRNLTDKSHVTFCGSGSCYIGEGRTAVLTLTSYF